MGAKVPCGVWCSSSADQIVPSIEADTKVFVMVSCGVSIFTREPLQ